MRNSYDRLLGLLLDLLAVLELLDLDLGCTLVALHLFQQVLGVERGLSEQVHELAVALLRGHLDLVELLLLLLALLGLLLLVLQSDLLLSGADLVRDDQLGRLLLLDDVVLLGQVGGVGGRFGAEDVDADDLLLVVLLLDLAHRGFGLHH